MDTDIGVLGLICMIIDMYGGALAVGKQYTGLYEYYLHHLESGLGCTRTTAFWDNRRTMTAMQRFHIHRLEQRVRAKMLILAEI
jgi:hypothetical protein